MKLNQLIELQRAGALTTSDLNPDGSFSLAGQRLYPNDCLNLLLAIGYEPGRIGYRPYDAINRVNSWASAFKKHMDSERILDCEVSFSAVRKADSEKFIERVHIFSEEVNASIVKGGGVGAYAVYEPRISQSQPQDSFSSMKGACEYINDL